MVFLTAVRHREFAPVGLLLTLPDHQRFLPLSHPRNRWQEGEAFFVLLYAVGIVSRHTQRAVRRLGELHSCFIAVQYIRLLVILDNLREVMADWNCCFSAQSLSDDVVALLHRLRHPSETECVKSANNVI